MVTLVALQGKKKEELLVSDYTVMVVSLFPGAVNGWLTRAALCMQQLWLSWQSHRSALSVCLSSLPIALCALAAPWVHLPVFVYLGSVAALTVHFVGISGLPVCDWVAVK